MYQKKPTPLADENATKICPVCGQKSYSAGGIHPQCAVQQADAPREKRLKANRAAEAKKRSTAVRQPQTWNRKKCPSCKVEVHVRLKKCACGHDFFQA